MVWRRQARRTEYSQQNFAKPAAVWCLLSGQNSVVPAAGHVQKAIRGHGVERQARRTQYSPAKFCQTSRRLVFVLLVQLMDLHASPCTMSECVQRVRVHTLESMCTD